MPTLAARLALSAAGAVVILTGIEALRWRHPRARAMPPEPDQPLAEPPPAPPRFTPSVARPLTARPVPARPLRSAFALGRIHGRLLGSEAAREHAELTVEDETGSYEPRLDENGTFEIHLPPGSYAISASAGRLVALVEVLGLAANEDREVVLLLAEPVAIRGRVEGCDGPCADASIHVVTSGSHVAAGSAMSDSQGEFAITDLSPRQAYDLTVEAPDRRSLTLQGLSAPTHDVVVTLEPSGVLAGGFGVEPGQDCPMRTITIEGPNDSEDLEVAFDPDCRFRIEGLPDVRSAHVRATGAGWHFSIDVALPEHGDPPFLCLRAPCSEPVPEAKASLAVIVADGPGHSVYLLADFPDQVEARAIACHEADAPCVLDELRVQNGVSLTVSAGGCAPRTYTVDLMPGPNYLTSPCETVRYVRGAIRDATATTRVRCSSQHPARPSYGGRFAIQCPARLGTVEYRREEGDPWQTVPLASAPGDGVAVAEIDAP